MKKLIYIICIAATVLATSCNGFLDEKNKSNLTSEEYYKTPAGMTALLNATYGKLRTLYGDKPISMVSGTDLYLIGRARGHFESPLGMYKLLDPTVSDVEDFYKNCYQAIGNANAVLYYATTSEQTTDLPRKVAEARFLRAFYYFHLVQQFGGVPLVNTMTDRPILEFPRSTEAEVYDFIIKELEELKANLMVKATGADYGHVDQRTANYYLAKVYLTRGWIADTQADFLKAKDYMKAAIGSQKLTLTFEEAYSARNVGWRNEEVIWSVMYSLESMESLTKGNSQQSHFGGYLDGSPAGNKSTDGMYSPTLYAHYLFARDIDDPNKDCRYNLTFMEYLYEKSMCYYTKSDDELKATKITKYYPTWWQPNYNRIEAWRAENTAQRAATTVRYVDNPGNPDTNLAAFQKASADWTVNSNTNYWYPTFRKFDCPGVTVFSNTGSFRDIDLARVDDAYLTLAEACIKLNQPDEAAGYINEVRRRAIDAADPKREITAAQATIDFVLEERGRELMGQYDRWYDLKRTKTLIDRAIKFNPELEGDRSRFVGLDGNDKILRPIPQAAIDANKGAIKQNPGYLQ